MNNALLERAEKINNESGQSLVQFALMIPILLLLLSMAVEVARIVDAQILLNSAACEATRSIKATSDIDYSVETILYGNYADRLNLSRLNYETHETREKKKYYNYHARDTRYGGHVNRTSFYTYKDITVVLTYELELATPISNLIFNGGTVKLTSKYIGRVGTGGFDA